MINSFLPIVGRCFSRMRSVCIALAFMTFYFAGTAQSLYEGFNYTVGDNIGGNTNTTGGPVNNWYTHNNSQVGTIDVSSGSLSYTGLQSSVGNKVRLPGTNATTTRDVNTGITGTGSNVAYYSVLVNIVDNTQLNTTGDYFMHFGAANGISNTIFGGRLGIKSVNTGANFRLLIQNQSGGTPSYTEFAQDLNFGTTYLVVVKFDKSVTPNSASLWVNPSSLGGAEPAGAVTNATGTNTLSSFSSICLRNGSNTPKADIDEIRVGTTWADVTPSSTATAPAAPTITSITAGNGQLTVAFTAGSDGGSAITNYQYSIDGGTTFTPCSPAQTTSPIVITGLTNGTTYPIQILAVNSVGPGTPSASSNGTPVAPVTPTLSASTITSFGSVCINTTAGPNTFTVSGAALNAGNITVGPLTGFSFSDASNGTYSSTLTITQAGGTLASTTVFVSFSPTAVNTYDGNIPVSGGGATTINVSAVGAGINTSAAATTGASSAISSTGATLAGSYTAGCAAVTTYGIEYSLTNGFTPGTGSASPSTNQAAGSYSVTLSGLTASTTYYYVAYATAGGSTVYGTQSSFTTSSVGPPPSAVIAAWDFNGYSSIATLAATTFNANLVSAGNLSDITRGADAAASAGANSFRTVGFKNEGIATTNTDYFQTTLQTAAGYSLSLSSINAKFAGTASFYAAPGVTSQYAYSLDGTNFTLIGSPSTSTTLTLSVDVTGVVDLQNVPSGTTVYIRYYASGQTTTGGWGFNSATAGSNGLEYTGSVNVEVVGPKLVTNPKTLSFGNTVMLTNSASQSFDLSGTNLSGAPDNITITAPSTDFEVSNDNSTWGASTTIAYTAATLNATPVYVRFTPQSMGVKSGNISITGGGVVTTVYVALSGTGITNAAIAATNLTSFGDVCINTVAGPNSFVVNGANLTNADIVVGPLAGYTFSTSANGTFTATLNIPQGGGTTSQTVYVLFSPTAETTYSGDIPVDGGGIPTIVNVPVVGNGVIGGAVIVTGDTLSVSVHEADLLGEIVNGGCSPVTEYGIEYSSINGFAPGFGIKVSSSNINASVFSSRLTGLIQNTTYYYRAFAINGSSISYGEQKQFFTDAIPAGLVVYSTPLVRGGTVHYSLSGITPGHYFVRLINISGQRVFQKDLVLQVDFIDDSFILPAKLPVGVYTLQVMNLDFTILKQILVQ